mmetsp:Transcript_13329/g.35206  ORF Transcript_13329/g.35206 Transcript_13329/m.35206 type:complete len:210 (-) Transcript_13329:20-649(-)
MLATASWVSASPCAFFDAPLDTATASSAAFAASSGFCSATKACESLTRTATVAGSLGPDFLYRSMAACADAVASSQPSLAMLASACTTRPAISPVASLPLKAEVSSIALAAALSGSPCAMYMEMTCMRATISPSLSPAARNSLRASSAACVAFPSKSIAAWMVAMACSAWPAAFLSPRPLAEPRASSARRSASEGLSTSASIAAWTRGS